MCHHKTLLIPTFFLLLLFFSSARLVFAQVVCMFLSHGGELRQLVFVVIVFSVRFQRNVCLARTDFQAIVMPYINGVAMTSV